MRTIITTDNKLVVICNTETEVAQLKGHDWFYGYSDDTSAYRRGEAARQVLVEEFGEELITTIHGSKHAGAFGCFTTEAQVSTTTSEEDTMTDTTTTTKPEVNTEEYHKVLFRYFRSRAKNVFSIQLNRAWTGKQELFANLSSRKDGDTVCIRIRKPAYDKDKRDAGRAMRALQEAVRSAGWKATFVSGRYSGELHISKD